MQNALHTVVGGGAVAFGLERGIARQPLYSEERWRGDHDGRETPAPGSVSRPKKLGD